MNAGKLVTIVFIAFASFIGSMVFFAFTKNADLVREDYYENELRYDDIRAEKANYNALNADISITQQPVGLVITFPLSIENIAQGNIMFYRADNMQLDRSFPLELNESRQQILNYTDFVEGSYEVTINWEDQSKAYQFNQSILF